MATIDDVLRQMAANGMPPFPGNGLPCVNTYRIIRYGQKNRAWYRIFEVQARNGRTYLSGAYGIWGRLNKTKIDTDWAGIDDLERARMQRQLAEAKQLEEAKRRDRAEKASRRAKEQYLAAKRIGIVSPYL